MALNQREKRLLLIPVALGAMLAFYTYVHEPLFARKAEAAEQVDKISADLKRTESRLTKEGNLVIRQEAVAAREKVIDAWVPGKNSAALFIWYLSQAEQKSGARIRGITVSEKKLVTATSQQQSNGQNAAPAPKTGSNPATGTQQAAATQPSPSPAAPVPAPTLTVVTLDLRVDARFAQHLQFNQGLEEMPLFLNTAALTMAKDAKAPVVDVNKLVQEGNVWHAAQLLGASPNLNGTYKVDLYFKSDKQGPQTDTMQFAEAAGRIDPFAMNGVNEFLQTIMQFYSGQPGTDGNRGPLPPLPEDLKGQLG